MSFLNQAKINAMKKIRQEFSDLNKEPDSNLGITVGLLDEDNIFDWKVTLFGPADTPYKGGIFILNIHFPDDYPNKPPEVIFETPIYHVNVNHKKQIFEGAEPLGHVCISTLNWWKPIYKIREVLTNIFALFYKANPDSPYGLERANELRFNKSLYENKIKYFTQKYANPAYGKVDKEYKDSWDFSYN